MKEKEYKVTWTIDLYASSPKAAAKKALAIHRDPESIATVFDVAYQDKVKLPKGKMKTRYVSEEIDLGPKG